VRRLNFVLGAALIQLPIAIAGTACFVDQPAEATGQTATTPGSTTATEGSTATSSTGSSSSATTATTAATATEPSSSTADETTSGSTAATEGTLSTSSSSSGCAEQLWFPDDDDDGFGDPVTSVMACEAPRGYVPNFDDCDDDNGLINPTATEICDQVDNNCNDMVDEWSPANEECGGCTMSAFEGSVYHICESPKITNAEARDLCTQRGGDLVVFDTLLEVEYVLDTVLGTNIGWWIGLDDLDEEGTFVWVDGSPLGEDISQWAPGEPNNANDNEHCAILSGSLGSWNDNSCTLLRSSICESPQP